MTFVPPLTTHLERPRSAPGSRQGRWQCSARLEGTNPDDDHTVLHAFARFVLEFTGEDEVAVEYMLWKTGSPGRVGATGDACINESELRESGVVSATVEECADIPGSRASFRMVVQKGKKVPTEFGILIANTPNFEKIAEDVSKKPFFVTLFRSTLTLTATIDRNSMPDALVTSIFDALTNTFSSSTQIQKGEPQTLSAPSVLNHPPQMTPPAWDEHTIVAHTLHAKFMAKARAHPHRTALDFLHADSFTHTSITYKELDELTSALAHRIIASLSPPQKGGAQQVVPVFLSTSLELYISWLAILKAGCAFCPLPVEGPAQVLVGILDETSASLVLGSGAVPAVMAGRNCNWLDVQAFARVRNTVFDHCELPVVEERMLAYIMFTSGSTGMPKGVKISHHSAVCAIAGHAVAFPPARLAEYKIKPLRWFQFASPTFDPSVLEIFTTFSFGWTLCACPRSLTLTDPEAAITELAANIMSATPSMAAVLRPEKVPTLRYLWTSGEILGRSVIDQFSSDSKTRQHSDKCTLVNLYGPTEAAINCSLVADMSIRKRGSIIGSALPTCSLFVIEAASTEVIPVPLGFPGELAVGGPQLSLGYLNQPDATAKAFVQSNIFGRVYRTGDRARVVVQEDGSLALDFLGRITDDQVKLSGRRVDLGDIEAAMAGPMVVEAAAVATSTKAKGSEHVVVFLVARGDQEALYTECVRKAEQLLHPHMRPMRYLVLERMPRSAAGKLDRKALKRMLEGEELRELLPLEANQDQPSLGGEKAEDNLVCRLRGVLSEITGIPDTEILPTTALISLGFDSLHAVRFLQRAREIEMGYLTIVDVLTCRTISDLAEKCRIAQGNDGELKIDSARWDTLANEFATRQSAACAQALSVPEEKIEAVLPTTATQSGMLASFLRSVETGHKRYMYRSIYTIDPKLKPEDVQRAWTRVFQRHEATRTVFLQVDDEVAPFAQCVLDKTHVLARLVWAEYSCESHAEVDEKIALALIEAEHSTTLERPSVRLAIVSSPGKHVIALSLHHAVLDGGSLLHLLEDIEREFRGQPIVSRPGIAVATQRHFDAEREKSAEFWRSALQDDGSLPFPNLRSTLPERIAEEAGRISKKCFMSTVTRDHLRTAATTLQVSALAVLHTAWALILHAYTGQPADITFGSVVSDRFTDDLAACSAATFTTVPVRVSTETEKSNLEMLSVLTALHTKALQHLHTPLSSSVLGKNGRLPYDTMFAYQDFPLALGAGERGRTLYSAVEIPAISNDFALLVEVWPTGSDGYLELQATYSHDLLDDAAVETMLRQLDGTIKSVLKNPKGRFVDGQWALERELLSEARNGCLSAEEDGESATLLHRAFEKFARETPDETALVFRMDVGADGAERRMTYAELESLANELAAYLATRLEGRQERVVPICMAKCPDLYVAILGILKAGAAWCPIDPAFPPARQEHLINRTGANIVLVSSESLEIETNGVPEGVSVVDMSTEPWQNAAPQTATPPTPSPSSPAYLIFTSGTTGLPKGVPVSHCAAAAAMHSLALTIPTSPSAPLRCMQFSQYTFDVFVQDLFYTWRLGGTLISAPTSLMVGAFADLANITRATHAHLTPAFGASIRRSEVKTLRVVTMIGEKLSQAVADVWSSCSLSNVGHMQVFNTYGPAEAAVVATARRLGGAVKASNIGWPLPTVTALVMRGDRPVIRQAVGELVLAGPQLANGYWRDDQNTLARFCINDHAGGMTYRTGDMVRQLADGSFDFVGRNDDLVKINGMRVEPSEIAVVCREGHPAVEQTEVLFARVGGGEMSVVCFVGASGSDRKKEVADAVKKHAAAQLPRHMVPTLVVVVDRIPRNPSAKVDRKALAALLEDERVIRAARGSEKVKGIEEGEWQMRNKLVIELLNSVAKFPAKGVGPRTTLAELGVDSIGILKLSSKLKRKGHEVSVLEVLRCRYVGHVAELVVQRVQKKASAYSSEQDMLVRFDSEWKPRVAQAVRMLDLKVTPVTIMQEGMLTETMRTPEAYWGSFFFELGSEVDLKRLREAWKAIISTTEALRAGFVPTAGLPDDPIGSDERVPTFLQIIYDAAEVPWSEVHFRSDIVSEARTHFKAIVREHTAAASFTTPPWRVSILKTSSGNTMMLTAHHALYDAESITILSQDLASAYLGLRPPTSRCQISAAAAHLEISRDQARSEAFWAEALEELGASNDGHVGKHLSGLRRTREMHMEMTMASLSESAASTLGSSVMALFRVSWGVMLAELLETESVLFAEIRSDRVLDPFLASAVAPLVSAVPVPFTAGGRSLRELVERQDRLLAEGLQHRLVRPETVRALTGRTAVSGKPLYSATMVFHPLQEGDQAKNKLWQGPQELLDLTVEHPYALNIFETKDCGILLSLSVDETTMSCASQDMFLSEVAALVESMVSHPDVASLDELAQHFPAHLQSVSTNPFPTKCPSDTQPTHWVEQWAAEHADYTAVKVATELDDDGTATVESWTYAELNSAANQVAHWLNLCQRIRGQMVGMCLDRSLLSFAIIAGIMKSGNTYLPIEEELPMERKMFLLKDGGAKLIFTTSKLFDTAFLPPGIPCVDITHSGFLAQLHEMPTTNPADQGSPHHDVYVLYTSGSTGRPKGCRISRRNLSSFIESVSELIHRHAPATHSLAGKGSYLCLASRAFDVHLCEAFLAWRHGLAAATGRSRLLLLDNIPAALRGLRVTHASFVPSLLDHTGLTPDDAPELVWLTTGGEQMTRRTQAVWGGCERVGLVNAYGPTEVTIGCAFGAVSPKSDPRNIGFPLGDSAALVLVPGTEKIVKRGMPGELVFVGSLVGNGYRSRLDVDGFVRLDSRGGQWAYRTGDVVSMAPDGSILFLGRADDQVKVRGQRLELGEICEAVRGAAHKEVDVATLLLQHPALGRRLQLTTFVAETSSPQDQRLVRTDKVEFLAHRLPALRDSLKAACAKTLPAYMVPDLFVPVSRIPLTQTSVKVDNKLLGRVFVSIPAAELLLGEEVGGKPTCYESARESAVATPSTRQELSDEEVRVVEVLKGVLPIDSEGAVHPGTTMVQLGLDSLRAISLAVRLKKAGYEGWGVAEVLQNPTITEIARRREKMDGLVKGREEEDDDNRMVQMKLAELAAQVQKEMKVKKEDVEAVYPCLPLQEVLAAHSMAKATKVDGDQVDEANYVNHVLYEIPEGVDVEKLRKAWERVVKANSILRTVFVGLKDRIAQAVLWADKAGPSWKHVSADTSQINTKLAELRRTTTKDMLQNLESQPAVRVAVLNTHFLLFSIHHALYDLESLNMLVSDLRQCYHNKTLSSRPTVDRLIEHISILKLCRHAARAKKYWQDLFRGYIYQPPVPSTRPITAHSLDLTFKTSLSALEARAAAINLGLAALMQGLFGFCLAQITGRADVVFGVVLSGRSVSGIADMEKLAVPCITTVPVRVNLREAAGSHLLALLSRTQERHSAGLPFQHSSLRDVQAWVGIGGPLFREITSFVRTGGGSNAGEQEVLRFVGDDMTLEYALALEVEANVAGEKLVLHARYAAEFGKKEAQDLLERMELLAGALLAGEEVPVRMPSSATSTPTMADETDDDVPWDAVDSAIRDEIVAFCNVSAQDVNRGTAFIRLGVDSISAIRFAKNMRGRGLKVSSADVVRSGTLRVLAGRVREKSREEINNGTDQKEGGGVEVKVAVPSDVKLFSPTDSITAAFPLTPLQSGMLTSTLADDPRLYSHHHTFVLASEVDLQRLREAWTALLNRHDILRTSFHQTHEDLTWTGAVHSEPLVCWCEMPVPNVQDGVAQLSAETKFGGAAAFGVPPVKVTVLLELDLGDGAERAVVLSLHHVVYDGVSIQYIFEDLWALYFHSVIQIRPPFAHAAMEVAKSACGAAEYWIEIVKGYRGPAAGITDKDTAIATTVLPITDDLPSLLQQCARLQTTPQLVCLLAFAKSLAHLSTARDIVFGHVVAGRNLGALDGADLVSGPLFNTVPMRVRLADVTVTNASALSQVKDVVEGGVEWQHGRLSDVLKNWRENGGVGELIASLFVFQNLVSQQNLEHVGCQELWTQWENSGVPVPSEYGLNLEVHQTNSGLSVLVSARLSRAKLEQFTCLFADTLQDTLERPDGLALAVPKGLAGVPVQYVSANIDEEDELQAVWAFFPRIQAVLAEVANAKPERITPATSIFALGLDSILAIRVASLCRRAGVMLGAMDVMRGVTVQRLCKTAAVKAKVKEGQKPKRTKALLDDKTRRVALARLKVHEDAVEDVLPALPGQEYHLAAWLRSGRTFFEPTWAFETSTAINIDRLRSAWTALQCRHGILRTAFVAVNAVQVVQVVMKSATATVSIVPHNDDRNDDVDTTVMVEAAMRDIAAASSSLFAPPVRMHLVRGKARAGDTLLLTIHHAAYDAWSMVRMVKELEAVYNNDSDATSDAKAQSFANFVDSTLNRQRTEEMAFWRNALGHCQATILPSTGAQLNNNRTQTFALVPATQTALRSLRQAARKAGVTPQALLFLAFSRHLSARTGVCSPLFGYFQTGRALGGEAVVGPCLNILPAGVPVHFGDLPVHVLRAIQSHMAGRMRWEQSSLRDVLGYLDDAGEVPFNAFLNIVWGEDLFFNDEPTPGRDRDVRFRPLPFGVPTDFASVCAPQDATAVDELDAGALVRQENLWVDLSPRKEGVLQFGVRCDASVMKEEEVREFVGGLDGIIAGLVEEVLRG